MTLNVQLTSTSKTVELKVHGVYVRARIWEGHSEGGVPVIAMIIRIAAERDADLDELECDLVEQVPPSAEVQAWPARMVLP